MGTYGGKANHENAIVSMTESLWCLSKRGVCPRESSTHRGKLIHELGRGSGSNVRKNRINPSGVFFCERSVQVVVIRIVFKIAFPFFADKRLRLDVCDSFPKGASNSVISIFPS